MLISIPMKKSEYFMNILFRGQQRYRVIVKKITKTKL